VNPDKHQNDDDDRSADRRCRVHHDAEWAVVGVVVERMDVRHLGDGQQRKQEQANYRRPEGASVWPAGYNATCLKS